MDDRTLGERLRAEAAELAPLVGAALSEAMATADERGQLDLEALERELGRRLQDGN
jgi:hypothetical protein